MSELTKYRVDRAATVVVPCGMNSILYTGDNWREARYQYDKATTGVSPWGTLNPEYGVLLSVWNPEKGRYVAKCVKGFQPYK